MPSPKENAKLYIKHRKAFYRIFGDPLDRYWPSHSQGFDAQKFDAKHAGAERESRIGYILRTRGEEAARIIRDLTDPTPAEIEAFNEYVDREPLR